MGDGADLHPPVSVLVVDDDHDLVEVMQRALNHFGMATLSAETGDDALRTVRTDRVDEVVLDVMIPHPDGIEVARQLRRDGWSGPLVMISARTAVADRDRVFAAGADAFLPKPFSLRTLCDLLLRFRDGPGRYLTWPPDLQAFLPAARDGRASGEPGANS